MKPFLISVVLFLFSNSIFMTANAQMPPLIDREIFFGNPEIAGAQISPDGKYIAFLKPYKETRNIWFKRTEEPFATARPLTNRTDRPVPGFFWSRDGKYILFTQDKGGDENHNVYAVNPADKNDDDSDIPPTRNLTEAKGVRTMIQAVRKSDLDAIYVGINERDKAWHDLYKVKISTGERALISENKNRYQGMIFDNAGKMRLAVRSAQNGDTEILRFDAGGKAANLLGKAV